MCGEFLEGGAWCEILKSVRACSPSGLWNPSLLLLPFVSLMKAVVLLHLVFLPWYATLLQAQNHGTNWSWTETYKSMSQHKPFHLSQVNYFSHVKLIQRIGSTYATMTIPFVGNKQELGWMRKPGRHMKNHPVYVEVVWFVFYLMFLIELSVKNKNSYNVCPLWKSYPPPF